MLGPRGGVGVRVLAAVAGLLVAGCSPDDDFATRRTIERGDVGEIWPFDADRVTLECQKGGITSLAIGDIWFALEDRPPSGVPWVDGATEADVVHIRDAALELCG